MKSSHILAFATLLCASTLFGQDGWLFSAAPPLIVRFDRQTVSVNFTNTSDAVLHGITLNTEKDGQKAARVIIDTIQPHATFSIGDGELAENDKALMKDFLSGSSVTCVNYSKPLKIALTIQ